MRFFRKKGEDASTRAIIATILVVASAVVIFLFFRAVMCGTKTWNC